MPKGVVHKAVGMQRAADAVESQKEIHGCGGMGQLLVLIDIKRKAVTGSKRDVRHFVACFKDDEKALQKQNEKDKNCHDNGGFQRKKSLFAREKAGFFFRFHPLVLL